MANIASNGTILYKSSIEGNIVRVNSLVTNAAPGPLMGDVIAIGNQTVGIVARVGSGTYADRGYCCTLNPLSSWTELGPTSQLQSIAWKNGQFVCARVNWTTGELIEQTITGSIIRVRPTDTSQGILYFNERLQDFVINSQKVTTVGQYQLIKAIERSLNGQSIFTGQKTNPDQLFTTNGGSIAFKSGPQPNVPQFCVVGSSLVVNGGVEYKPPYPTTVPPVIPPVEPPIEPPIPPEPTVGLPTKVNDLWKTWNQRFPLPLGEENIRNNTIRFCEQTAYQFPNEGYGTKSSAATNPISKDTVSKVEPSNANNSNKTKMTSWDLVLGAGTTNPTPVYSNHGEYNTTDQYFHAVNPVNHLGTVIPPNPEPNPPSDNEVLAELKKQTELLLQILEVLEQQSRSLATKTVASGKNK